MNNRNKQKIIESTRLLSRLTIDDSVISDSTNVSQNCRINSKLNSQHVDNINRSNVFNHPYKISLPLITNSPNQAEPDRNVPINFNKIKNEKVNSNSSKDISNDFNRSSKKIDKRSVSTLGRFLSTPSGVKTQEVLDEIFQGILTNKIKRIVIMTGAGISCPSGIPDFRTPGSGLYDNLKQYNIPFPEAIFDINYFKKNPQPFFTLAKHLFPSGKYRPNKVHYFFKLLQQKNLLSRVYTQNIDGLERLAGIPESYLVEAHGTFVSATCTKCGKLYSGDYIQANLNLKSCNVSQCVSCKGVVKPDIVFFGEDLPARFNLFRTDFRQADLLLVMGTSLEVEPFASIVNSTRFGVPRLLINRHAVGVFKYNKRRTDHCLQGDIVVSIDKIVKALHWESELRSVIEAGERNQISFLDTVSKSKHAATRVEFKHVSQASTPPVSIDAGNKSAVASGGDSQSG